MCCGEEGAKRRGWTSPSLLGWQFFVSLYAFLSTFFSPILS